MKRKYVAAGAAFLAAIAGGTAIAATSSDKQTESAILSDAAKQLGVTPDALRSALSKAEDAQLDAAVKAGKLTQEQADDIKQHRAQDGTVLGFGHGPGPGGPGFGHRGGPGGPFLDLAKALGISETKLHEQLEAGKSLGDIAKAAGTSLDAVKASLKKQATERLDADLKAGRITKAQHDDMLAGLDEHLSHLGDFGRFGPPHPGGPGFPHP